MTTTAAATAAPTQASAALYRRRLRTNRINLILSMAAMAFGMIFLLWILIILFGKGFAALSPTLFTQMTPPPGSEGGLANAIFGSIVIVAAATFISTPPGAACGEWAASAISGRKPVDGSVVDFTISTFCESRCCRLAISSGYSERRRRPPPVDCRK